MFTIGPPDLLLLTSRERALDLRKETIHPKSGAEGTRLILSDRRTPDQRLGSDIARPNLTGTECVLYRRDSDRP
jgi:hypothetical protein